MVGALRGAVSAPARGASPPADASASLTGTSHVRDHRHLRRPAAGAIDAPLLAAHERVAAPPRPGRGRPARRAGRRARPPAAVDHRRRDRPAAAVQRGRVGRASSTTARSTTTASSCPSWRRSATCSAPAATPRSSSTPGRQWGEACVERFRGMFAFALWDRNRGTLFLARDRLGVKPLYYALLPDGHAAVRLGAEGAARARRPAPRHRPARGRGVLRARLRAGAAHASSRAARKLPPAHTLAAARGEPLPAPARVLGRALHARPAASRDDEACERARVRRLRESVELRLISEVPLGAFLSGGVDSSAVVAMMAGVSPEPVNTCSIAFGDPAFDESRYAQAGRRALPRRATSSTVSRATTSTSSTRSPRLYDEPYADSSAIPTYRVCQLARQHVTVALSGDGGDESFGGYRRYRMHMMEERMRAAAAAGGAPAGVRPARPRLPEARLGAARAPRQDHVRRRWRATRSRRYFHSVSILRGRDAARLYSATSSGASSPGTTPSRCSDAHAARAGTDDPLALVQYLDLKTYLVGRHQHQGRPREHGALARGARAADGPPARRVAGDAAVGAQGARRRGQVPVQEGDGAACCRATSCTGRRWASRCRSRAGSAGRCANACARRCSVRTLRTRAGSTSGTLRHLVDEHQSGRRDYSAPLWTLLMFEAFLRHAQGGVVQRAREGIAA